MYVTRPLSLYRSDQCSASASASVLVEGPNTGVLVIEDEGSERRWFFGLVKDESVEEPPFPQNKLLELRYKKTAARQRHRRHPYTDYFYVMLIPVLNQPPNSNQYYVIDSRGKSKGLACTSSKEDDMISCCCFNLIDDIKPQLFDPTNPYQQFQINSKYSFFQSSSNGFISNSMAPDGVPPYFLRHQGWTAETRNLDQKFDAAPALGIDAALRARLPELDCTAVDPVVVGKWYCPFIFIREGDVGVQMRDSTYYEMTLQQNWEEIFGCYNNNDRGHRVTVDVCVRSEAVLVGEALLAAEGVVVSDGIMWFSPSSTWEVGLSMAIVERVKWEEERVGFVWGRNDHEEQIEIRTVRREEFEGKGTIWRRFRCYVLVEKFVLKRMNGTLVLTWEFRHTHQIRTKWE
ncbi:hypothetical protein Csa_009154 [Cucumis sativus]|uniref:Insecticidal crystal toxin domain-containing protein n=2 Tax=Cucumis sativus TaxID=3659 RepID=A0A0A0KWB8_CUCSA|nr:hypothetical protein Csa_009154 [Cucumis sativus]